MLVTSTNGSRESAHRLCSGKNYHITIGSIDAIIKLSEISGSHGGEYEDCCLLGCSAV
jgi:hypothetical protein